MQVKGKKRIDYSWVIIGVCALLVCTALGFCSSSKGLYVKAICEALDISRSAFSINDSIRYISTAIVNLFFGFFIVRYGAKRIISAGVISLAASCLIYAYATNIYVFYIGGALLGIGLSWTTTTIVGYIVNIWCKKNQGTITGAILASNGIGAVVATQTMSPVIHSGVFGYQKAYLIISALLVLVLFVVIIFFKNSPHDEDHTEESPKKKSKTTWVGVEYSVLSKKPYFYGALICIFLTGMVLQGMSGISTPCMYDAGVNEAYVATVLSVSSVILTCSKFLVGFLNDKAGIRLTTGICMIAAVLSFLSLTLVSDDGAGRMFCMGYAVFSPIAFPLETIMLPLYATHFCGEKSFARALGLFVSVNTAGYAVGAPLLNLCFDITGNYNIGLYASCAVMAIVFISMNLTLNAAKRHRREIEKEI